MSARARTTAGSRERGRPRAVPGVLCENHLRGVSMCRCSKKDGSALFANRKHCLMVQSGMTRVREQNHSFTSGGTCILRRFVQGSAGSSSPAPSPAAAGSSPAGSATAVIAMSSCTTTCSATVAIVSCIGCPRCHHAGGSGPRSSTPRSMASMSRPRPCRHSVRLDGLPTRRDRTRGHGSRRRAVCARRHSRLVSSSSRAPRCAPAPTTNAVSELCMTNNCSATNTWDEKHCKITINLLTAETNTELEQLNRNSSNGGTQQEETRAMVVLNRRKLEQWWYSTGGNSSNGGTQQKETQRDDMRDNQHV